MTTCTIRTARLGGLIRFVLPTGRSGVGYVRIGSSEGPQVCAGLHDRGDTLMATPESLARVCRRAVRQYLREADRAGNPPYLWWRTDLPLADRVGLSKATRAAGDGPLVDLGSLCAIDVGWDPRVVGCPVRLAWAGEGTLYRVQYDGPAGPVDVTGPAATIRAALTAAGYRLADLAGA